MEKKFKNQLKAYLLSHQRGTDPDGFLAKLANIAVSRPSDWDGKLPVSSEFQPDLSYCKFAESAKQHPIIPWWWYVDQNEPVPSVVEAVFHHIVFDYVLVYPQRNIWIYFIVEPQEQELELMKNQDSVKAFIMMSLVNKNFKKKERAARRLRLGRMIHSPEIKKILTFMAFDQDYSLAGSVPKQIPSLSRVVNSAGTDWTIHYPGQKQSYETFGDLLDALF